MLLCTISGSLTKVCPASPHRAKLPWCTWKSHQHAWCHYVGCLHGQVMYLYEPSTLLVSLCWLPDVSIRAINTLGDTMLAACMVKCLNTLSTSAHLYLMLHQGNVFDPPAAVFISRYRLSIQSRWALFCDWQQQSIFRGVCWNSTQNHSNK